MKERSPVYKRTLPPVRLYREFIQGVKNLLRFRKAVWNYRWYDYGYFVDLMRTALEVNASGWKDAHYVGSEKEEKELKEIVDLLYKIKRIEEEGDFDEEKQLPDLYEELGRRLFVKQEGYTENGRQYSYSNIQKFWD